MSSVGCNAIFCHSLIAVSITRWSRPSYTLTAPHALPQLFHVLDLILFNAVLQNSTPRSRWALDMDRLLDGQWPQKARNKLSASTASRARRAGALSCCKVKYSEYMSHISQGSVTTYWTRSGSFCHGYTQTVYGNLPVKECWISADICISYDQKSKRLFYWNTAYIGL